MRFCRLLILCVVAALLMGVWVAVASAARAEPIAAPERAMPSWAMEPAWLGRPTTVLPPVTPPEVRPEPIPLPAAAVVGPVVLTALMAAASLKKRRPRARVLR